MSNINENINNSLNKFKKQIVSLTPYGTENFLSKSSDFFNSNTLIAKASFLLFVIIIFICLYYVSSKILKNIFEPEKSPILYYGLYNTGSNGQSSISISQNPNNDGSAKTVYRSENEYDGIEFSYSVWVFINDLELNSDKYYHVFHKGSTGEADSIYDIFGPNNCPGVYLYTGTKHSETGMSSNSLNEKNPTVGLLTRLNVFNNSDSIKSNVYYDDIHVEGIPIKKWVNIIIRSTSQNIVDIYINGTLTKRHELTNVIKQNYNDVHINLHQTGYPGYLSDLKYYNYAIGTMEINNIVSAGPTLVYPNNNQAIVASVPDYLSSKWYFNETELN
tara:strand:+ start:640 stop:1635 length:996 start_codon:yes stop_codon:yes gene_type:complete